MNYKLVQLAGGAYSIRSLAHGETFHPVVGPVAEAESLYVNQLRLRERLQNHVGEFVIWDVGLGAAANALTVLRAALVNYQILARVAERIGLQDFVLMSRGERKDTGRAREVILANAIEAVIGAFYLDQGLEKVRTFVKKNVMTNLDEVLKTKSYRDAKSELQELIQEKLKVTPTYSVLGESGPAHNRIFTMGAYFGDKLIAQGEGPSKQEAELEAAKAALKKYR